MKVGKKLRRERLLKLATYLVNLPPEREFRMSTWGYHDGAHPPKKDNYCGTAACALGHAAMIPAFRREGLKLEWNQLGCGDPECCDDTSWEATITFKNLKDGPAGGKFFGLDDEEMRSLFYRTDADRLTIIGRLIELADCA